MKSLDIILRTCDRTNVHVDWRTRYCKLPKTKIVVGCTRSLVNSIKQANGTSVNLVVLDDHSSTSTLDQIKSIISEVNGTLVPLTNTGYNHSAHEQWLRCRDSTAELVYSVEDDYLHCASAVKEMIDSYAMFSDRLKRTDIVLYPFDEPSEYNPPNRTDFIVHGSHRHWRTGIFTTNVLFTVPKLFKDNWELFETLALKYNGDYLKPRTEHFEESNTIWNIWKNNQAIRFNPIPSLALHLQFDQQQDPYINWQQWWKQYAHG
jgi:glycosyltransferase involved in cell wall biosynthesis